MLELLGLSKLFNRLASKRDGHEPETRLQRRNRRLREIGGQPESMLARFLDETPRPGARWLRRADGTWHRWSYLGGTWEPAPGPPPVLQPEAEVTGSEAEWIQSEDGTVRRVEPQPEQGAGP